MIVHQFCSLRALCFIAGALCFSTSLSQFASAGVIDQSQTTIDSNALSSVNTTISAQSFVPTFDNVLGVRVAITANETSPISFELYSTIGPGATPLATAVSPTGYTGPDWAEATFSSPVAVTPGTTYYLVFSGSTIGGPPFAGFGGTVNTSPNDAYADGFAIVNPFFTQPSFFNGVRGPGNPLGGNFDFAFQTLSAVPEPRTGLACLAFFCSIGIRRRRKS